MSNQSLREAAQLAIDAYSVDIGFRASRITREALEQLRAALAQPDDKAQPVAYRYRFAGADGDVWLWDTPRWQQQDPVEVMPVYATPPDQGDKTQPPAPTFEQFCKKYGLDPEKMDSGGGMWARVAIEDWQRAIAQPPAEQVMVDMTPPATARDRWMYEQGRLAERDPRTHAAEQSVAFQYRAEQVQKYMKPVYEAFNVEAEKVCKCSLRTRLVGDGCSVCNPELAKELVEQSAELSDELLHKEARLALGRVPAERYRNDLLKLMRKVIAADRAARGGAK